MSASSRKNPKQDQPHITPTGPGLILMFILVAMLTGSVNYGNNMAFILCFLLTGLMMIAYLATRNNLKGLEIANAASQPVFAGDILHVTFELHNHTRGRRVAIFPSAYGVEEHEGFTGPFSVPPYARTTARIAFTVPRRGRFVLSRITLLSVFPLGLFRVQHNVPVNKVYIVYPKPFGSRQWPEPEIHEADDSSEGFYNRGGDDFVGVRPYRPGEPMYHIDWKAYARGRPLSVKEFTGGGSTQLWFDWDQLASMGTEERLSQLARWVLEAEQDGKEFGLRIPGSEIKLDTSPGHTTRCLEALAVFQFPTGQNE
jgi:uncharacterized protein (DUF58 family)